MDTIMWALRLFVLFGILVQSGMGLKCYTCTSDTNEECSREEDVTDCDLSSTPTTKYDTCQTKLTKSPEQGVKIIKKCTVGPCVLATTQNHALGLYCDRSGPTWDCEECCNTDRCNISSAPALHQLSQTTWPLLLCAAILAAMLLQRRHQFLL